MKIKKVYLGRKQIYPDGWNPGENTIAYYKFNNNLDDSTENHNDFTVDTPYTYETIGDKKCAIPTVASNQIRLSDESNFTCSLRVYADKPSVSKNLNLFNLQVHNLNSSTGYNNLLITYYYTSQSISLGSGVIIPLSTWTSVVYTKTTAGEKFYVNGTLVKSNSGNSRVLYMIQIGAENNILTTGKISELIIESKEWTAEAIEDYYNQNKSNYGIS